MAQNRSADSTRPPPASAEAARARLLAPPPGSRLYGIIDGVSVPDLRSLTESAAGRHGCLFPGPLPFEVERAAPHLVELDPDAELARRWWGEGWGEHWGILAHLPSEWGFNEVRRHFRTFLRVRLPDKRTVLFRYYDPRVLRAYLPTCTADESAMVFGPVTSYLLEDPDPSVVLRFTPGSDGVELKRIRLDDAADERVRKRL